MLAFGLFSIGLAIGCACVRAKGKRIGDDGAGTNHSVGLNGILVAGD